MARRELDDYVGVHTRVEKFREAYADAFITTELVSTEPITMKATVGRWLSRDVPEDGPAGFRMILGTAYASEEGGVMSGGKYNRQADSTLEKVETAAVGRALAFAGIEVKAGIASKEEMEKHNAAKAPTRPAQPSAIPNTPPEGTPTLPPDEELEREKLAIAAWVTLHAVPKDKYASLKARAAVLWPKERFDRVLLREAIAKNKNPDQWMEVLDAALDMAQRKDAQRD